MRDVVEGGEFVFDPVADPRGKGVPRHADAVAGKRARPHEGRAGFVVVTLVVGALPHPEDGAQHRFAETIGDEVRILDAVLLEDVGHDVGAARGRLLLRNREGVFRIADRNARIEDGRQNADLLVLVHVRDDGGRVVFAPRRGKRQNRHEGEGLRDLAGIRHDVPGVAVVVARGADRLGAVDHGAAAHGEDEVDVVFAAKAGAFVHARHLRIGFDAGAFVDFAVGEKGLHFVVDAELLDGTPAVDEEDLLPEFRRHFGEALDLAAPEKKAGRRVVVEIVHGVSHCLSPWN